jgi:hypothetical protein
MEAASAGNVRLCKTLLDTRADLTRLNSFNLSAKDFAEDPDISALFHERSPAREMAAESRPSSFPFFSPMASRSGAGDEYEPRKGPDVELAAGTQQGVPLKLAKCVRRGDTHTHTAPKGMAFEWEIPAEKVEGLQSGRSLQSDFFCLEGVSCRLFIEYFPKGDYRTDKKGLCGFGIRPAPGETVVMEDTHLRLLLCLNDDSEIHDTSEPCFWQSYLVTFPIPEGDVTIKVDTASQASMLGSGRPLRSV